MAKADLTKHTLNLRQGDFDYLESVYRESGTPTSHIIRTLVARHVDGLRAKEAAQMPEVNLNV